MQRFSNLSFLNSSENDVSLLAKVDLQNFVDSYPNQSSITEISQADLVLYMSQLLETAKEHGVIDRFPSGVRGYMIFLMLAETTRISSMECDFADFTYEDLNIYKSAYQTLFRAVEERFEKVFNP